MRYSVPLSCLVLLAACQALRTDPQSQIARLAGTSWRVDSIAGAKASPDIESTLEVDDQAQVVGRGGCSPYVSNLGIEAGKIRFEKAMAAEIRCSEEQKDQEKRFFGALDATRRARIEHKELLLQDDAGQTLVRLKPATLLFKPLPQE